MNRPLSEILALLQVAQQHLAHCPDCRQQYEQRLHKLELQHAQQSHSDSVGLQKAR
jgi:predicted anti-sigma-YlaC factor YlaD